MAFWVPFAIAAGASALGGAASLAMSNKIKPSQQLLDQISKVENPNYYVPMLQRLYNSSQGDASIGKSLARQGLGNNEFLMRENLEANQSRSGEMVKGAAQQMEGQRMSLLERLTSQRDSIDMQRQQAKMSAVNQMVSGIGGSLAGLGQASFQNNQFNQQQSMMNNQFAQQQSMWDAFMQSQTGGGGGNSMNQLPMGGQPQGYGPMGFGPYRR
jgi:hypothetical protein